VTAGGFGPIRATDIDRERTRSILRAAHEAGRLDLYEFDRRSAVIKTCETRDQLAALTADLPGGFAGSTAGANLPGQPGAQGQGFGTQGQGFGTQGQGFGTQGQGFGTQGQGYQSYQGNPTNQPWARPTQFPVGLSGGLVGLVLKLLIGPTSTASRYYRFRVVIRLIVLAVVVGAVLYVGFVKHQWVIHSSNPTP